MGKTAMKRKLTRSSTALSTAVENPNGESLWSVEKILARKYTNGEWTYRVKWEGWPSSANSWEPMTNLLQYCSDMVVEYDSKEEERLRKLNINTTSPGKVVKVKTKIVRKNKENDRPSSDSAAPAPVKEVTTRSGRVVVPPTTSSNPKHDPQVQTLLQKNFEDYTDTDLAILTDRGIIRTKIPAGREPQDVKCVIKTKGHIIYYVELQPVGAAKTEFMESNVLLRGTHLSKNHPQLLIKYYESVIQFSEDYKDELEESLLNIRIRNNSGKGTVANAEPIAGCSRMVMRSKSPSAKAAAGKVESPAPAGNPRGSSKSPAGNTRSQSKSPTKTSE